MRQEESRGGSSIARRWLLSTLAVGLVLMILAPVSSAKLAVTEYTESLTTAGNVEEPGGFLRQAGSHPDFITQIGLNEIGFKTVHIKLPPGLLANPTAIATCSFEQITSSRAEGGHAGGTPDCPVDSQVGLVRVFAGEHELATIAGIFNLPHPANAPALLAFNIGGVITKIEPRVRPSDYGIEADTDNIGQGFTLTGAEVRIWGVPAESIHDSERFNPEVNQPPFESEAELKPFLIAPTSCDPVGASFELSTDSWWEPGVFAHASVDSDASGIPFRFEGCDRLRFEPSARAEPDRRAAASPVGLTFSLTLPQNEAFSGVSTADLRRAVVRLPSGMSVSPSVARGLSACGLAEIGLGSSSEPTCPATSQIGSVEIKSPLLEESLHGSIFVARQNENPFNSLLALYMVVRGPGIMLKLPGRVTPNPSTGQLTVEFDDTPQLPFETLKVELQGGARAPLVSPPSCGVYSADAELTSWASDAPLQLEAPMTFDQNCSTGGFDPGLRAGTKDPAGGSFSPFVLQVTRQDGEADLSRIQATLPPGLLAKLSGVPLCGDAQAASGDCPAGSQVGRTTVGVGAGSSPVYVPEAGKSPTAVYLAGPYKGAPYSLVVKVPAQAGPFDLGTVVVRNALKVDPFTTQVTAESDPLPQILEGIPISYRDLRVEVDRPEFTLNPTSCSQLAVTSSLISASGQTASPKAPFAATNCERLGFKPHLKLQLKGSTKRTGKPALKAVLTYPHKGAYANIARAQVSLPGSEFLEQANLDKTCTRPVLMEGRCPKSTVYGKAKAWSPLLDKPLEGPVYLVGGFGYQLPALVADLGGQIRVILKGRIDTGADHGLRTTFEGVPDARVSRFVLQMKGGRKYGLLVNSEDICKKPQKLKAAFTAQNGKTERFQQKIATSCGGKKPKK